MRKKKEYIIIITQASHVLVIQSFNLFDNIIII